MTPTNLVNLAQTLQQCTEITLERYIDQLEEYYYQHEPEVLAFVSQENRFQRLLIEGRALIAQYPNPDTRPPLFCVPVGIKDIFHVQGFPTHAGSMLPHEELQGHEADSVSRLKAAGALIMGKTVTTEFAYFAPGPTRNPHNAKHSPGGSSSGSAAAVGAGLCPLSLGTQTIGSITRPAAYCGVVGYKPTYERISRSGVIPLAPSIDHVGPFATNVADAELAAAVLVQDWTPVKNHKHRLRPRLGIPSGPYLKHTSQEIEEQFGAICNHILNCGLDIRSIQAMPDFDDIQARHNLILAAEAARVHAKWFARYEELYNLKTAKLIQHGAAISDTDLQDALQGREKLRNELTDLMNDYDIDLWISPSATGPAPNGLTNTGDPVMNLPWTHSGLPTLGLPCGTSDSGLPLGLQLAARYGADEMLFLWAAQIEEVLW